VLVSLLLVLRAAPAGGAGFTELAGYIFGGNSDKESMEMTTPGGLDAAVSNALCSALVLGCRSQPSRR
jgi:hypothetical protein